MRRLCPLLGLLMLAALSPAPIQHHGPAPYTLPTPSQAELEQQQKLQRVIPEVGYVPAVTNKAVTPESPSDPGARNIVGSVVLPRNISQPSAAAVLRQANDQLAHKGHSAWLLSLIIVLLVLGAAIYGFIKWLDSKFPYVPRSVRLKLVLGDGRDRADGVGAAADDLRIAA